MNFKLREIRFLSVSIYGIKLVSSFYLPEVGYHGHFVVFKEHLPKHVYIDSNTDPAVQKEIDYFYEKHNLSYTKFISNILVYTSKLSLIPTHKSKSMIYFKETGKTRDFDLDFIDLEPFWIKLSSKEIERIISKSRKGVFDFLKGY